MLAPLVRLAAIVTSTQNPEELVEAAAEAARELLQADVVAVSRMEADRETLRTLVNVGQLADWEQRWPTDERYEILNFPDTLGFLRGGALQRTWVHVDDEEAEPAERELLRSSGRASSMKAPIVVDGEVWGELWAARTADRPAFDALDGDVSLVVNALISAGLAQAAAWETLTRLARTDALTGLSNRRDFDERLAAHLALGQPVTLVVGDVNGLKSVNDRFGHAAGDDALLHVARTALAVVAAWPGAVGARLGGDEFALVLPGDDLQASLDAAARWCTHSSEEGYGTSLSCGIASTLDDGPLDARDLLRAADEAQYEAKRTTSRLPLRAGARPSEEQLSDPL